MNRILWIFICILLIIVLFGVTAYSCTTYENMTTMEAVTVANEYAQNLRNEITKVKNEIDTNNKQIDATQILLEETKNKLKNLDTTATDYNELRKKYDKEIYDYQELIVKYQNQNELYNNRIESLEVDISKKTTITDFFAKQIRDEITKVTNEIDKNNKQIGATQILLEETKNKLKNLDTTATDYNELSKKYNKEIYDYQELIVKYQNQNELYNSRIKSLEKSLEVDISDKTTTPDLIPNQNLNPNDESGDTTGVAFVAGPDGKMTVLKPTGELGGSPTYYEPGTYKFGSATYVPTYEDSIYLSKTTGKSTVSNYLDEASIKGGSCSYYKNQPEKLEEMCMAVDKNNCGAMSCCVLLGGSKCVSGNKQGPYNKLNYGDITVKDKDYYYYQGKCYGNCK